MQKRAKIGIDFEKMCETDGWVRKAKSPKLKWNGKGRGNITKIKNCNFNPTTFTLSDFSELSKYDIYHPELKKYREVKRYKKTDVKNWTLYSEPYFKIASVGDTTKIDNNTYNKFVQDFWDFNQNTGLIEKIQEGVCSFSEGIVFIDGFVPKEELEFRTVIVKNAWKGYYRITIEFKLK
jgi:hypothetical protein